MAQIHHLHRVTVSACTQQCSQGRACTCQPEPAEPCTDIGADQPRRRLHPRWAVLILAGGWLVVWLCWRIAYSLPPLRDLLAMLPAI